MNAYDGLGMFVIWMVYHIVYHDDAVDDVYDSTNHTSNRICILQDSILLYSSQI